MNVLVNEKKAKRAKDIVDVLGRDPKTEEETALKATFSKLVKEEEVADKDVLEFIYTKLGGLVRTEVEHKKAETKSKKLFQRVAR